MSVQIPGLTSPPVIEDTYPGNPLKLGDIGPSVLNTKNALNAISVNYPAIPKITPVNSEFGESMEDAVKQFQRIFNLHETGIIDKATWYEIRNIFNAVRKLAQSTAEGVLPGEIPPDIIEEFEDLAVVPRVQLVQYFLNVLSVYYESIPAVDINGMLTNETQRSIMEFQKTFNLPITGSIDEQTWDTMYRHMQGILLTLPPSAIALPALLYPQVVYREGMEDPGVFVIQEFLLYISSVMPDIPPVEPNGIFGPETTESVIAFQNTFGLEPDGIIGEETWNKLVDIYRQLRFSHSRIAGQFPGSVLRQIE